ncbi:MAG: FAD binding domain-containing protein [Pseudomonadota bacterium]
MKPAPFTYEAPSSSGQVVERLRDSDGQAKLLAGSQSLGPMLNLRLARPATLIDVTMLPELRSCRELDVAVEIGAAVTHAEIEDGDVLDPTGGWLQAAAANIAHRAVRNRGTLGGSLVHADPAADWVIVMTGLGAVVLLDGPRGEREIGIDAFITGPYETDLAENEILRAVRVKKPGPEARWSYRKFARQVGEFAKASATVLLDSPSSAPRIAVGALGRQPLLLEPASSQSLIKGDATAAEVLAKALPDRSVKDLTLHAAMLARAVADINDTDNGSAAT